MLLGTHNVVHYRFLKIWADNGLVKFEDMRDGKFTVLPIHRATEHLKAINDMLKKSIQDRQYEYAENIEELQNAVADIAGVIKQAKEQGDPFDPKAVKDRVNEYYRSRPARIAVPAKFNDLAL